MAPDQIQNAIIIILILMLGIDIILELKDIKTWHKKRPKELKNIYEEEEYVKASKYNKTKTRFGLIQSVISSIILIGLIWFGTLGSFFDAVNTSVENNLLASLLFLISLFTASQLFSIPFQWYNTFKIEDEYGFNRMTPKLFLQDTIKSYALSLILISSIFSLFYYLTKNAEVRLWLLLFAVLIGLILFFNVFYTKILLPLFNKIEPLQEDELKSEINDLADEANFPLENVYTIDGSKRSAKANAFFSGMGKQKKVVLFDTLLDQLNINEILAVLAHEIGHYKKKHIWFNLIISFFSFALTLALLYFSVYSENMSKAMGSSGYAIVLNLIAFGLLYSPLSLLTGILSNYISRIFEYQADRFAARFIKASFLRSALEKLSSKNYSNPHPSKLDIVLNHTHPPVYKRLEALKKYE